MNALYLFELQSERCSEKGQPVKMCVVQQTLSCFCLCLGNKVISCNKQQRAQLVSIINSQQCVFSVQTQRVSRPLMLQLKEFWAFYSVKWLIFTAGREAFF